HLPLIDPDPPKVALRIALLVLTRAHFQSRHAESGTGRRMQLYLVADDATRSFDVHDLDLDPSRACADTFARLVFERGARAGEHCHGAEPRDARPHGDRTSIAHASAHTERVRTMRAQSVAALRDWLRAMQRVGPNAASNQRGRHSRSAKAA